MGFAARILFTKLCEEKNELKKKGENETELEVLVLIHLAESKNEAYNH
jgi:hypothetical protein